MKALGLLSGGLDSTLAARIVLDQGVEVEGVHVNTDPLQKPGQAKGQVFRSADQLGIRLHVLRGAEELLDVVRKPKHGFGQGTNPCIDCRIFSASQRVCLHEGAGRRVPCHG